MEKFPLLNPKVYVADEHEIDPSYIDRNALSVLEKLRKGGHEAYLVGGSVRDLLTKKKPKDFDISTSALPEEVKAIFGRQCILIGRRFRLAHIRFGHHIIEVATFRSGEQEDALILQDNVWGTEEEDILRRDFTINGLLYDPHTHQVIDYIGGWKDIHEGILRTIGDPSLRFRQDPVRMIRAMKFRARFGFEIEHETKKALLESREEIVKSSPARILEEMFRMLESGYSAPFFHLLMQSRMLELLFPLLNKFMEGPFGIQIFNYLEMADKINLQREYPLARPILASCLLYPILEHEIQTTFLDKGYAPHIGDITILAASITSGVITHSFTHFPKRISCAMSHIMSMQYRLTPFEGKKHYPHKLFKLKEFSESVDFFRIRALVHPELFESYQKWQNLARQHEPRRK